MDDSVGKVLSWEEKEKLKEKLAFLKREYSKTLARLQRAQRAEKAKNSLKTEQNCMLKQETSIQTNSEPEDKVSLGDKLETCTVQIDACLNAETKEKTTVALDFEPELSNAGDGSGVCPEHIDDNCQENFLYRITEPDNKKKQNKQPLNRMKTQKKTLVSKESESFFSSDSLINAGQRQQKQVFATENPELSVFQVKNHFSCGEREIQNSHRPITEMNECLVAPANELKNDASAILEENNLPERATLSLHNPLDDSNIQQLECVPLEDVCDNYKLTTQYSMNLIHGSPKKLEEGEKEHVISPGDQMINVDMNVNKKMSSILTLPSDDRAFSANERNHSLSKNTHFDEHNHSLKPLGSCSNILDSRGESFQKKEVLSETANPNIEIISPVPTENPLNSCTVLDGLLFPVEYYVRTTRQMSNCQRAVDLEAVIQSQLGVKRKGFKHKCKQVTKNLDLSSQEQSELLLSDQGNSSSPFQKSFSSATEGSPAALPTKDNDCALKACKRKGFKHKCKQVIKNLDLSSQEQSELLLSDQGNSSSPFQRSFSSATEGSPAALPTKDNDCALKTCKRRLSRRHRGRIFFCKKGIDDQDSELQVSDNLDIKKPKEDVALFKEAPRKKERVQGKKTVTNKSSCILANVDKKAPTSIIQGKQDYIQNKDLHSSIGNDSFIVDNTSFDLSFHLKNEILSFEKLLSGINITDFDLPDENFGFLKLEKLKSYSAQQIEPFDSGAGGKKCIDGDCLILEELVPKKIVTEKENLAGDVITVTRNSQPKKPKCIPQNMLLFTPSSTNLPGTNNQLETDMCSPVFPILGATPVFGSQIHSGNVASEITGPTFCTPRHTNLKKQNNLTGDNQCNNSPNALKFDTNMHSLGGEVKKQPDQIVPSSEKKFDSDCGSQEILPSVDSITFKERPLLESTFQTKVAEHPAEIWCDSLKLGNLQLLSQLKNPSDSCSVDVSTVWWEVTGCKESCIITACEFTVSLWKSLDNWQWRKVYTWHFTEIPVLQIIPLWDACNLVCVALGHLEIREIRLLFCSDDECLKQSLVKSGNIKAVLGLRHKRLVCSNGTLHDHQVDLMTFSASGRSKEKQTLMSPEETILAFAEVQGMQDALLGTTLMSSIVIWNLKTGQLLKKMQIGNSYQASICHKAYSDMGLLFVVLSHPHGKEIESMGTPIFRLIVINPKTALSVDVQPYSLPQGHTGRFLDGEVKDNLAAAVLTSGTIAVWDLFLGHCTALLLPNSDGNWSFVKWSGTDSCLLAGQKNGSVFVYSYI
ncbi:partner and localizer of BRCA2 isoform X1 [Petaurus breviceps papuanus]|uniref:partner and localizer of BRCA2 isoform X1 n=1 Tax=Petaurus breviceps papuanus TaxID=3040969 RepID=UPI0036D899DE